MMMNPWEFLMFCSYIVKLDNLMVHFKRYRGKSATVIHRQHHQNAEIKSSAIITNTLYTIELNV